MTSTQTTKAARITPGGGIESLIWGKRIVPDPGEHEVRIKVRAVSLNYRDLVIASGHYPLTHARPLLPISDGAGTTFGFTDYLSKVSPEWQQKVGKGTSPNWPVGLGGKGNDGVAATVSQTPGAVGYVELAYATINKIPYATLRNSSGNWIVPSLESVTAAMAGSMKDMGPNTDFRVSITNASGPQAYPIATMTWLLVHKTYSDAAKARALVQFIWWAENDGQAKAPELGYAPPPKDLRPWIQTRLKSVTAGGKSVFRAE